MGNLGLSSAAPQIAPAHDRGTTRHSAPHVTFGPASSAPDNSPHVPECEAWDEGRLLVNRRFARLLHDHRLTTCQRLFDLEGGEAVRRVGTRETTRITLEGPEGPIVFYLKRHGAPAWRDRIMPWLHGARPIHGARNEWEAILRFIGAGIPTMTPVAFGEIGGRSLLITQALPARCNLLEFIGGRRLGFHHQPQHSGPDKQTVIGGHSLPGMEHVLRELTGEVADIARKMHAAGLHHQDFYLNHLLLCDHAGEPDIRVIDLGRVREQRQLALRWIVKDLAQLNFSAERLSSRVRLRFLRMYLGRPFTAGDRRLIRRITFKSQRIATHTAKHDL
jgi:heptose I phosphotransferase